MADAEKVDSPSGTPKLVRNASQAGQMGVGDARVAQGLEAQLKTLIEEERARFQDLSDQYDKCYDPPAELEQQLLASKKKLQMLEQRLQKHNETLDNASLRYFKIPPDSSFAIPDSEENLSFEDQQAVEDIPTIKSGTLEKLVERVTFDEYSDPAFLTDFLLTYRTFTTPEKLLDLMIERYHYPTPEGPRCVPQWRHVEEDVCACICLYIP